MRLSGLAKPHRSRFQLGRIRDSSGKIPKKRRKNEFAALTDEEAKRLEAIYSDVFE